MANFTISDGNRFVGDFSVEPTLGHTPGTSESSYIKDLAELISWLADIDKDTSNLQKPKIDLRSNIVASLRADAQEFCDDKLSAEDARTNIWQRKGAYLSEKERIERALFHSVLVHDASGELITDLDIIIGTGTIPPDQQKLYVDIDNALTVINSVHRRMVRRHSTCLTSLRNFLGKFIGCFSRDENQPSRMLNEYVGKLHGVAQVGLEQGQTQFADLGIAQLKREFVIKEGGAIKNTYARSLGAWAVLMSLMLVVLFYSPKIKLGDISPSTEVPLLGINKNFYLLLAGSCMGTWLSFSIRRVTLAFEDLASLEEDGLDPPLRLLFVIVLTTIIGLIILTGTGEITVGDLKIGKTMDENVSLLIGSFCGIAERALSTAISGRAAAFAKALGG